MASLVIEFENCLEEYRNQPIKQRNNRNRHNPVWEGLKVLAGDYLREARSNPQQFKIRLNSMYWSAPEVPLSAILPVVGEFTGRRVYPGNIHKIPNLLTTNLIPIDCPECGNTWELEAVNRSELSFSKYGGLCSFCKNDGEAAKQYRAAVFGSKYPKRESIQPSYTGQPYAKYLQSEHWQTIKRIKLEQAVGGCQLCGSRVSPHVHHRTYERRGCERLEDLTVLCAHCHESFHDGHVYNSDLHVFERKETKDASNRG